MSFALLLRLRTVSCVFLMQSLNDLHLIPGLSLKDVCARHSYIIFSLVRVLDILALHDSKLVELFG